jgi:hypothetical protein
MSSYTYTNWRGKKFVIDEGFVNEMIQSWIGDGSDPEDFAYLTPEIIMRDLPVHEEMARLQQLEQMWEGKVNYDRG